MTDTFTRSDTLLGVCEALGEDLGVNPLWPRLALTAGMLWSPLAMIGLYLAAGAMLLVVRRLTRVRPAAEPVAANVRAGAEEPLILPLAA